MARLREGLALLFALGGIYVVLSLLTFNPMDPSFNNATPSAFVANMGGRVGAYLSDMLMMLFGLSAFLLAIVLLVQAVLLALKRMRQDGAVLVILLPFFLASACVLLHMLAPLPSWPAGGPGFGNGGLLGRMLAGVFVPTLGVVGCSLLFGGVLVLSGLWLMGGTLGDVWRGLIYAAKFSRYLAKQAVRLIKRIRFKAPDQFDLPLMPQKPKPTPVVKVERPAEIVKPAERVEKERQPALPLDLVDGFELPPLHLLDPLPSRGEMESEDALTQNARRIEGELKNFGVEAKVTKICPGPVITIYELEPAPGVKTSQIVNLADDLARAMSALAIRIAPIPGRNVIGIELPNRNRQSVGLRELFETDTFETHAGKLTVAMGVDTSGQATFADISKMPHALIAGTTGSGKSVAMNAFILSLLYRMTPEQLKFVMIDPKMLELSIYNDIPHLLTPVITDPNKAAAALNWVVKEMENRYRLMSELQVKNIASFNAIFSELQAEGKVPTRLVQTGFDPHTGSPTMEEQPLAEAALPYMVVVIDELADLMMVAGKAVELYIARLTQMARAAGIHLLVATQRPSVDVVTGLIKANIPTRISFNVTSRIDSRTVLDSMGAEQLLGKGDMLYMANGSGHLQRLHGAFVSEDECNKVADFLRAQAKPGYIEDIFKNTAAGATGGTVTAGEGDAEADELFMQAVQVVAKEQKASTSFLQRHLKIGYNRAADLIDRLEAEGMISAANHVGKREVIVKKPE